MGYFLLSMLYFTITKEKVKKTKTSQVTRMDPNTQLVGFVDVRKKCVENCGSVTLTVERSGVGISSTFLSLDFTTVDGKALAGSDYEEHSGKVTFKAGQKTAEITIQIIDDEEFEEDKDFYVKLSTPRLKRAEPNQEKSSNGRKASLTQSRRDFSVLPRVKVGAAQCTITILDDDHCGSFHFEMQEQAIPDNVGIAKIKVIRSIGARGVIHLPFRINQGTGRERIDYKLPSKMAISFQNNQSENTIDVPIVDMERVGDVQTFFIELLPPQVIGEPPSNPLGNPVVANPSTIKIGICEDAELREALDRLLKVGDFADLISSTSWTDQFREALQVNWDEKITSDYSRQESGGQELPPVTNESLFARIRLKLRKIQTIAVWILSLPWKLLAASLPPASIAGGWLAFILLLSTLALIAALIGDLATQFGFIIYLFQK